MTACKAEIWLANLNPQKKANEIEKMRPVLVLQSDLLNQSEYSNTIVLPLSTQLIDNAQPLRFRILKQEKLKHDSDVLIGHIRSIDNARFVEKLTTISISDMKTIRSYLLEIID